MRPPAVPTLCCSCRRRSSGGGSSSRAAQAILLPHSRCGSSCGGSGRRHRLSCGGAAASVVVDLVLVPPAPCARILLLLVSRLVLLFSRRRRRWRFFVPVCPIPQLLHRPAADSRGLLLLRDVERRPTIAAVAVRLGRLLNGGAHLRDGFGDIADALREERACTGGKEKSKTARPPKRDGETAEMPLAAEP